MKPVPDHAVNRLRAWRKSISTRPFLARGGTLARCPACQLREDWCACEWRPELKAEAGFCLLMYDSEPMKPSNTGRLIADVLPDTTWAFLWSRTEPHPELLALLADPAWQPYVVFPACEKEPARLTSEVVLAPGKKPLFILLDGTWPEARKMFNKSPYLDGFPVLAIKPDALSTYGMRVANSEEHLCTAEVAACVLEVAGELRAGQALQHWFNLFSRRYMAGRVSRFPGDDEAPLLAALTAIKGSEVESPAPQSAA
ncbi:tRNA-uridine aminocarboxypropyltransferase [Aeromonas jandaei]|uniref:tRNA-uridine aminocarboxypropyltransferase n=1 Tax=Aeromonas jandaei TaxID=650 RepID=UPI00185FDA10|nr:DTW domain-containing protein [Aeromonas jandaei]